MIIYTNPMVDNLPANTVVERERERERERECVHVHLHHLMDFVLLSPTGLPDTSLQSCAGIWWQLKLHQDSV